MLKKPQYHGLQTKAHPSWCVVIRGNSTSQVIAIALSEAQLGY